MEELVSFPPWVLEAHKAFVSENGLVALIAVNSCCLSHKSPLLIIFLWLVGLLDLPFAPKSFLEALPQKSEQLFRRPKLQPLAGIHLFHRPFEPASGWVRLGSEPYYKGSTHVVQTRVFQKSRCAVSMLFLSFFLVPLALTRVERYPRG
jgi:hypothetical protein